MHTPLSGQPIAGTLFAAALFGVLSAPALAEKITLARALEVAAQTHPRLQAGVARTAAAAGEIRSARAYPNPELGFLAGHVYDAPPGTRRVPVPAYTFSQPLELGQLRPARIELARAGLHSSELALAETRLVILSNVRLSFYQVLRRDLEIIIAEETLKLAQDLRDRIRVRVDVGEVGRLELVRAEAEVSSARSIAANARIQRLTALATFRAAIGGEIPPDTEPSGTLDLAATLPPLANLRQQVLDRHPSLAYLQSEAKRASARLHFEQARKRPQPNFTAEIDTTNPSYRFGLSLTIPAWNRREGEIATAAANVREANYLTQARRTELLAALESAYGRFEVSNQEVLALEQGLMREAEEAVRAASTAYQLGERSILEVLDAQRVLRTVRLNLLNAQHDRQAAIVEIDELRAANLQGATP